jgi:hypothetical protein
MMNTLRCVEDRGYRPPEGFGLLEVCPTCGGPWSGISREGSELTLLRLECDNGHDFESQFDLQQMKRFSDIWSSWGDPEGEFDHCGWPYPERSPGTEYRGPLSGLWVCEKCQRQNRLEVPNPGLWPGRGYSARETVVCEGCLWSVEVTFGWTYQGEGARVLGTASWSPGEGRKGIRLWERNEARATDSPLEVANRL